MDFLTEKQAAERLGVSRRTLQRWRIEGGGPAFTRLGARRVAYAASVVSAWLTERTFPHRAAERRADAERAA